MIILELRLFMNLFYVKLQWIDLQCALWNKFIAEFFKDISVYSKD